MGFGGWSKIWVLITLCALIVYNLRWYIGVSVNVYDILRLPVQVSWWRFWLDYVLIGLIGNAVRLIGISIALLAVFLVWGPKRKPFASINLYAATAVLFEAIFLITLLPLTLIEIRPYPLFMMGYLLQISLVSPVLLVLSFKVWRYTESSETNVAKWAGIAGISYLMGIWLNNFFRWWFSLATGQNFGFNQTEFVKACLINSLVTLTISVVLAVTGLYVWLKAADMRRSIELFALSLIMVGLHFAVFLVLSALGGALEYAILVEIWPVALLGLGLALLKEKNWGLN